MCDPTPFFGDESLNVDIVPGTTVALQLFIWVRSINGVGFDIVASFPANIVDD